jgi:hypothetical protein
MDARSVKVLYRVGPGLSDIISNPLTHEDQCSSCEAPPLPEPISGVQRHVTNTQTQSNTRKTWNDFHEKLEKACRWYLRQQTNSGTLLSSLTPF